MYSIIIKDFIKKLNYPNFKPKAVFFDMDGVLFDSMPAHAYAWVKAMDEVGLAFSEREAYLCEGQTGLNTINIAFKEQHGREASMEERKAIYNLKSKYFDEFGKAERMHCAQELLNKIKEAGMQSFVVTGSGQPSLLNNIQKNFPLIFDDSKMITAFDVKYGKPHPEPFLMALKKSGVQAWEAIAIDNAPLGVRSASAANLFTIGLNTGILEEQLLLDNGANVVLSGMKELHDKWELFTEKQVKTERANGL